LIDPVEDGIKRTIGDTAYDTAVIYKVAGARRTNVIEPPERSSVVSRSKLAHSAREKTVLNMNAVSAINGRRSLAIVGRGESRTPFCGTSRSLLVC
jgi:hypothetical protein